MSSAPSLSSALRPVSAQGLLVYANANDLRRDLHALVRYVKGRMIKRTYRGNELPATDYKRLAQVIEVGDLRLGLANLDPNNLSYDTYGAQAPDWISYLDWVAVRMGFVTYDTTGSYRGYNSAEPSYPDNFMRFQADAYRAFLSRPLAEQESRLIEVLSADMGTAVNEFYIVDARGRLDRFAYWGSGVGAMPQLKFAPVRRFLLELLAECAPGTWYGTEDLIAYLKAHHRFFLIPQKLGLDKFSKTPVRRYGNFSEGDDFYSRDPIDDEAPDGFERVEGRYVERFLEGLPLTLGYLDVGYAPRSLPAPRPSRGVLTAFRVNERLRQAVRGEIPEPRVTVQPNFEIYVESSFYPSYLIDRLAPLAEIVREDTTTILRLHKQKAAAQLAENPGLDLVALLASLTKQALPQNVAVELQEWARHADVFTLYEGYGLMESRGEQAPPAAYTPQAVSAGVWLVRDPGALYNQLIQSGEVAVQIRHEDAVWTPLPAPAQTAFPRAIPASEAAKKAPRAVTLKREPLIALHFSAEDGVFEAFRKGLLDARCLVDADKETHTLTIAGKDEAQVQALVERLRDEYAIGIEDLA